MLIEHRKELEIALPAFRILYEGERLEFDRPSPRNGDRLEAGERGGGDAEFRIERRRVGTRSNRLRLIASEEHPPGTWLYGERVIEIAKKPEPALRRKESRGSKATEGGELKLGEEVERAAFVLRPLEVGGHFRAAAKAIEFFGALRCEGEADCGTCIREDGGGVGLEACLPDGIGELIGRHGRDADLGGSVPLPASPVRLQTFACQALRQG